MECCRGSVTARESGRLAKYYGMFGATRDRPVVEIMLNVQRKYGAQVGSMGLLVGLESFLPKSFDYSTLDGNEIFLYISCPLLS